MAKTAYSIFQSSNNKSNNTSNRNNQKSTKKITAYSIYNDTFKESRSRTQEEQDSFLNSWQDRLSNFSARISSNYESRKNKYNNPTEFQTYRDSVDSEIESLLSDAASAKDYYTNYRDKYVSLYGENKLNDLIKSIDDRTKYLKSVRSDIGNEYDYWNNFKSEDEYNQYQKSQKEWQTLSNVNLNTANNRIDLLEKQIKEMAPATNDARYIKQTIDPSAGDYKEKVAEAEALKNQYDDAVQRLSKMQREYKRAETVQNANKYSEYAKRSDFDKYAAKGAAMKSNKVSFANNDEIFYSQLATADNNGDAVLGLNSYRYMDDNEVNTYNYILAKEGDDAAEKYLSFLQESLNEREGMQFADKINNLTTNTADKSALQMLYGVGAGLGQWMSGTKQFFTDEELPTSSVQYGSAAIREDLGKTGSKLLGGNTFGQMAYDAVTTTANQAPTILLSSVLGGAGLPSAVGNIAGTASMSLSAAGNYYNQALKEGYTKKEARNYSLLAGASEGTLQYLLGGISKLGGIATKNIASTAVQNIDNSLLRIGADLGISSLGEGVEEYLQDILDPAFRNLCFNENNEIRLFSEDAAYSFLLGTITAGFLEGPSSVSSGISKSDYGKMLTNSGKADALIQEALTLDPNSDAYKLASKIQTGKVNANNSNLGELLNSYYEDGGSVDFLRDTSVLNQEPTQKDMLQRAAMEVAQNAEQYFDIENGQNVTPEFSDNNTVATSQAETVGRTAPVSNAVSRNARTQENPEIAQTEESELATDNDTVTRYQAVINDSGDAIEVNGIDSVTDGDLTVSLSDGSTVSLNDISFDDPDIDQLYEAASKFDTKAAKTFISGYDGSIDVGTYYSGFASIYGAARNGQTIQQAVKKSLYASDLAPEVQQLAYYAGQNAGKLTNARAKASSVANTVQDTRQNVSENQQNNAAKKTKVTQGVSREFDDNRRLNRKQRLTVRALDTVAKSMGRVVHLVESIDFIADENGKLSTKVYRKLSGAEGNANAYFNTQTNEYYIALDALDQSYLLVAMHETIHDGAANNAEGYLNLATIAVDVLARNGYSLNNFADVTEENLEELIANTVPVILTDRTTMDEFVSRIVDADINTRTAFEKFIDEVFNIINEAYQSLKQYSSWKNMELIENDLEGIKQIRDAYFEMLDGMENNQASENKKDDESRLSKKDLGDGRKYVEADRNVIFGDDPEKWGSQITNYINSEIRRGHDVTVYAADGDALTITKDTAGKAQFRNYVKLPNGSYRLMTDSEYAAKLRAEAHIDELAEVSKRGNKTVPDDKNHSFARDGFNYRTAYFKDDTGYYRITLSVGKNGTINTIYNVGKIVEAEFPRNNVAQRPERNSTSDNRVPQGDTTVNNSIRSDSEKDAPRFSMKDVVEESDDLIAVHNLTGEQMEKILQLEGFPMPSIAVLRATQGHDRYGDVSVIFDKGTIDPQATTSNKVYGGDAWTPTYPTIEYEANEKVVDRVRNKYHDLYRKFGNERTRPLYPFGNYFEDELNRYNGENGIIDRFLDDADMMQLYLLDSGKETIPDVVITETTRLDDETISFYDKIIDMVGRDAISETKTINMSKLRAWYAEHEPEINDAYRLYLKDSGLDDEGIANVLENETRGNKIRNIRAARRYMENGPETTKTEVDRAATEKAIKEATDKEGYSSWLHDLFDGAVKRKGIYNGKDRYTSSGNSRSFSATHWEETLENVVRAMQSDGSKGNGAFAGNSIFGLATKEYSSIKDIKADASRLRTENSEEYEQAKDKFQDRFLNIANEIKSSSEENEFIAIDNASSALLDAVRRGKSKSGIDRILSKEYSKHYNIQSDTAQKIYDLVRDISEMPTEYFEAKPERAVGLDEIRAVVMPNGKYSDIKAQLQQQSVPVVEYDPNIEDDRLRAMNSELVLKYKFSLKDTNPVDVETLQKQNEKLEAALELAKEQVKLTKGHRISQSRISKIASDVVTSTQSKYDKKTLAADLKKMFDYMSGVKNIGAEILNGTTAWNEVVSYGTNVSKQVLAESKGFDREAYSEYSAIREYLKNTPIRLTTTQKEDVLSNYGTIREFMRTVPGVRISQKNGVDLDSVWQELTEISGNLLDPDTSEGDMPHVLKDFMNSIKKEQFYYNEYANGLDEAAADLFLEIFATYMDAPEAKTFADKAADKLAKTKAKYRETIADMRRKNKAQARQIERLEAPNSPERKYRARIEKNAKDLYSWLTHPTDVKHVPEELRKTVSDFIQTIDFAGDKTNIKANKWRERLYALKDAMQRAERGSADYDDFYADIDPDFVPRLKEFINGSKDVRTISGMDASQLKELDFLVGIVKRAVTESNKLYANARYQNLSQIGETSISDMSKKKAARPKGRLLDRVNNLLNVGQLDSFSYFDQLGDASKTILDGLRGGLDKKVRNIEQAMLYMDEVLKDVDTKKLSGTGAQVHTFKVAGGELKLTTAQIMELYLLNQREQARGHIYNGGIRPTETTVRGKLKNNVIRHNNPIRVTESDVQSIISELTQDQKRIADDIQEFLGDQAADWGNEVSMKMYGYKKFTEENYYPIKSDDNYTTTQDPDSGSGLLALKNLGMTKATVKGANNPLLLGDIFDTFTRHVDDMSTYNAFVVPLSDAMKWFNYRSSDAHGESVKQSIERILGKSGKQYFINLIKDINGVNSGSYSTGLVDMLFRNAKVAAVGFNMRVVAQQPTAYVRASAMISPKYLAKAIFKKSNMEKAMKYSAIAQWKAWGFFDLNIGKSMRELIVGDQTVAQKIKEGSLWLAGKADDITFGTLWNACELETKEKRPDLTFGSEKFNAAVGKRLSEIIDRTQVVDSVFHRSQLMRSKNGLTQLYTSFMSEPTKSYNLLRNAVSDVYQNRDKASVVRFARTALSFVATSVITAAAASLADAFRDEDDEKDWIEKWWNAFVGEAVENANPMNLIPGLKDVVSMMNGYNSSRLDFQAVEKVWNSAQAWSKYLRGESKWNAYKLIYQSATALSSLTGIPVGNMMRTFNSLYNTFSENGIDWESDTSTKARSYDALYKSIMEGDTEKRDRLYKELLDERIATINESEQKRLDEGKEKMYADASSIEATAKNDLDSGLSDVLMDNPDIIAAYQYRKEANTAKLNAVYKNLQKIGFSYNAITKAINKYENTINSQTNTIEYEQMDKYKKENLYTAIRNAAVTGRLDDVGNIYRELIASSDADDPEKSLKSSVASEFKEEYINYIDDNDYYNAEGLENVLSAQFGYTSDDFTGWVIDDKTKHLKESIENLDAYSANQYIEQEYDLGRKVSNIKSSITSAFKDKIIDAYFEDEYMFQNLTDTLLGLEIHREDYDGNLYSWKTIYGWIENYMNNN